MWRRLKKADDHECKITEKGQLAGGWLALLFVYKDDEPVCSFNVNNARWDKRRDSLCFSQKGLEIGKWSLGNDRHAGV